MSELINIVKVRGLGAGRIKQQVYRHLFDSTNAKYARMSRKSPFADFMPEEDVQVVEQKNILEVEKLPRGEFIPLVELNPIPDYNSLTVKELTSLAKDKAGYKHNLSKENLIKFITK